MCIVHVSRYRKYLNDILKKDFKTVHHRAWRVIMSIDSTATLNTQVLILHSEIKTVH